MKKAHNAVPNERLREIRELRGWPRNYVADKICSDTNTIARWERGATFPSPFYRQRLCELFAMTPDDLGLTQNNKENYPKELSIAEILTKYNELVEEEQRRKTSFSEEEKSFIKRKSNKSNQSLSLIIVTSLVSFSILALFIWNLITLSTTQAVAIKPPIIATPLLPSIKPGGTWIAPKDKQVIHGIVYFSAKAYPMSPSSPAIDHVNFIAQWRDYQVWVVACLVSSPQMNNIFTCSINLKTHNIPRGNIQVSFNVYDQVDNVNEAPNGIRTVTYIP